MANATQSTNSVYAQASHVWRRYGVTAMTLHRWINDPGMKFPRPIYFGKNRFWLISELEAWEEDQPRARHSGKASAA